MNLEMKKIYIDSRFRTKTFKNESDFNIELPRSYNIPDGVIAHIDDIVIPVSWSTIDERNQSCYNRISCGSLVRNVNFNFVAKNYDGYQFATTLTTKVTESAAGLDPLPTFNCTYDHLENILVITMGDSRSDSEKFLTPIKLQFLTDDTLTYGSPRIASPNTINTIIRNTQEAVITESAPYTCYLDLFQTRNLYLTSSALASYDTVSNFGIDTIVKKIPCTAGYNKMIIQSSGSTLDGLDVSKRTLRFLDFKLVDSSFRTVPLKGNHFSFSIVFQHKR